MYRKTLMVIATTASFAISPAAIAAPAEGKTHCPPPQSGFISWDTSAEPYGADNFVDNRGNANGIVCAKPSAKTFVEDGVTYVIYNFIDD